MKTIIFDFDGTIANTLELIIKNYNQLAPKFKTKIIKKSDIAKIRGTSIKELMKEYNISWIKLTILIFTIQHKMSKQIQNIEAFEGMIELLNKLKNKNYNLGILTSNSKKNVSIFLKNNNSHNLFKFIHSEKRLFGKDKILKKILKKYKLNNKDIIYIGDEIRDVEACNKINIPIIAVTWGLNTKTALKQKTPNIIVDTVEELTKSILRYDYN